MLRQNVAGRRKGTDRHDNRNNGVQQVNVAGRYNDAGNLLIADTFNNRVIEANPRGEIVWQYGNGPTALPAPGTPGAPPSVLPAGAIYGPRSVQRIGDLTLILAGGIDADTIPTVPPGTTQAPLFPFGIFDTRVILVNEAKQILFSYGEFGILANGVDLLTNPISAVYVPSAYSTQVRSLNGQRIQQRDRHHHHSHSSSSSSSSHHHHRQYQQQNGLYQLNGGQAAFDGTILIVDLGNQAAVPAVQARVIEVNAAGQIVWQYPAAGAVQNPPFSPSFATRLANGNTLISITTGLTNSLIEVNTTGQIVRTITGLQVPGQAGTLGPVTSAYRLPNGNTLVSDSVNDRIVEINSLDQIVWQYGSNTEFGSTGGFLPDQAVRLANGDTLITDSSNNRVIRVNKTGVIVDYYGLALGVGTVIPPGALLNTNSGYSPFTTQLGLYGPSDAKIIGDYTGQVDGTAAAHGHHDSSDSHSHHY